VFLQGWLYIVTNRDGADNFKVVRAPVTDPAASNWEDVVPPRAGVILNDLDMYDDHLLLYETVDGRPRLTVVSLATLDASSASPHQLPPPVPIRLPADVCGIDPGANQVRLARARALHCCAVTAARAVPVHPRTRLTLHCSPDCRMCTRVPLDSK